MTLAQASQAYERLVLFDSIFHDPIGKAFTTWLHDPSERHYRNLARALWREEISLQAYLIDQVLYAENRFTQASERGAVSEALLAVARQDLHHLSVLFRVEPGAGPDLPPFQPAPAGMRRRLAATPDWSELAEELSQYYRAHGAGEFGRFHAFRWESGKLVGISDPDPIRLEELVGQAEARTVILQNTEQFLRGLPANNLLLYGDRGTGKSSTVKALVHRYGPQGLRLVEVDRTDLREIGQIMRLLRTKAQRFILFLDDLSFERDETEYKRFKSLMEGGLERRPDNVLVYATTNRIHLISESHADRQGDEVHTRDTLQEIASLSDRFGRTVIFPSPNQEEYLAIVTALAAQRGLAIPADELRQLALQWALWQNGRSGRTARQFIDDLCGKLGLGT
jgi:predicted AAA+ superfamily ATPase